MKIELVGTGSIFSTSNSACSIVNGKLLVDIPNGICKSLLKSGYDLNQIGGCLITHLHGDHFFDIPFLLKGQSKKGKRETPFIIVGVEGIEEKIKELYELAFKGSWEEVKENLSLTFIDCNHLENQEILPDMKVTSVKVEHSDQCESYGYLISNDGLSIGFTGDARMCDGVKTLLEKSDILVADMSNEVGNESHMGIDNIQELASSDRNKTIVATHMKTETKMLARNISMKNIVIPDDGYAIELQKVIR